MSYSNNVERFLQSREKRWFPNPEEGVLYRFYWTTLNWILTMGIWGLVFGSRCYHPEIYSSDGKKKVSAIEKRAKAVITANQCEPDKEKILFAVQKDTLLSTPHQLVFTENNLYYQLKRDKSILSLKDDSIGKIPLKNIKSFLIGKKNSADLQNIKVNDEVIGAIEFVKTERLEDFLKCIVQNINEENS